MLLLTQLTQPLLTVLAYIQLSSSHSRTVLFQTYVLMLNS